MAQADSIELRIGEGAWLKVVRILLFTLALAQLLLANTSPAWKAIAISGLLLVFTLISWKSRQIAGIQLVRLSRDGMVTLVQWDGHEIPGIVEGESWVSAWVCVLPVGRFDRWPKQQLLVCRSNNHPDAYRLLLSFLRLGTVASAAADSLTATIRPTSSDSYVKHRITDIMKK